MIACVCIPVCFGVAGPGCKRRMASPALNAHGARGFQERGSPISINRDRGREESLTSSLSIRCPCFSLLLGRALTCPCLRLFHSLAAASLALTSAHNGPASANRSAGPLPWSRSTVMEFALHELLNGGQLAPNVEGAPPCGLFRRHRTGSLTCRMATSSALSDTTSAALLRR
jgi:hypothetical protein